MEKKLTIGERYKLSEQLVNVAIDELMEELNEKLQDFVEDTSILITHLEYDQSSNKLKVRNFKIDEVLKTKKDKES